MSDKPFQLTDEDRAAIQAAKAEVDPQQMEINWRLTPAQRVQLAISMFEAWRKSAIYRLLQEQPELSEVEAQRIILQRYYEVTEREDGPRPRH